VFLRIEECLHDGQDRVKGDDGYHDKEEVVRDDLCLRGESGGDHPDNGTAEEEKADRDKKCEYYGNVYKCRIDAGVFLPVIKIFRAHGYQKSTCCPGEEERLNELGKIEGHDEGIDEQGGTEQVRLNGLADITERPADKCYYRDD